MLPLDHVSVKRMNGKLVRRDFGTLSCHLMRTDMLMWSSLVKYLALSLSQLKKVSHFLLMTRFDILLCSIIYLRCLFLGLQYSLSADFQRWRLFCLALGFFLLLLAPVVSSWVPFYYSSSMAIGILLVIIILLFQVFELTYKLSWINRKSLFVFLFFMHQKDNWNVCFSKHESLQD